MRYDPREPTAHARNLVGGRSRRERTVAGAAMPRHRVVMAVIGAAFAGLGVVAGCSEAGTSGGTDVALADTTLADALTIDTAADTGATADTATATDGDALADDTTTAEDVASDGVVADTSSADTSSADTSSADTSSPDTSTADTGPAPYKVVLTAPNLGQTYAADAVISASALVTGPAAAVAGTGLAWTLADADGSNPQPINGAAAVPEANGQASAPISPLIGVRRVTVLAKAPGGLQATADAAVVVCPAQVALLEVAGQLPAEAMLAAGKPAEVVASVVGVVGPGASLEVVSDFDGAIGSAAIVPVAGGGSVEVKISATPVSKGSHQFSLRMVGGGASCPTGAPVNVQVCGAEIVEEFTSTIAGGDWVAHGDAAWDAGGWLELTGNATSKGGAVYNKALYVQPGDVRMSMRIATGGGVNGGADGFAMTILEAKSPTDVDAYLGKAGNGGCLGYGVSGTCGSTKVEAFHVEIDTWLNKGDPNDDPPGLTGNNNVMGAGNHIAVHLDGDAGNALLWLPEPGKPAIHVEDLKWHTVTIVVQGDTLTIRLDDSVATTKKVSGLDFRGGFVIFSGSTGWATNFHRIDDLRILHQCN